MPSVDREDSHDRELVVRHQHSSSSDGFRGSIPMWDSSDPERAPPPLPLNPGSPATRPNVSANIQAAANALAEKSRENAPSSYTVNPSPLKGSPEKSLIKGQYHKRLQSTPHLSPRELPSFLDNNRSPERVGRPLAIEAESRSRDKTPPRENTPTPNGRESRQDSPSNVRISSRYLSKPLLGENTPPSATMLALQNMQIPNESETPLSNITNSPAPPRPSQSLDALSSQILGLTNIATALQREMAQLSRRSKDNATDLVSLKAATTSRDEDIRKSLQDLVSNLSSKFLDSETPSRFAPNTHSSTGGYMLDSKAHDSSPSSRKNFSLPRIPSPSSFAAAIERDITASPGAISTDGSASIALLEKVLREMATKEGQDKLLELMDEIKSRPSEKDADNPMAKMLEEILNLVKENSGSRALVRSRNVDFEHESPRSVHFSTPKNDRNFTPDGTRPKSMGADMASGPHMDEVMAMLKRIKGSVAEGGGLTNEVKSIVRELRGEVLGMGREIARQLEQGDMSRAITADGDRGVGKDEIAEIVDSKLTDLRGHMESLIREKSRQPSPMALDRPAFDSQEMYFAVKNALAESPLLQQAALEGPKSGLEKEEILETVREAWETYKPEIELQNFGLERDEILDCLSEGLKDYKPSEESRAIQEPSVTHEQVIAAVKSGLEDFTFPRVESDHGISKDEIILTIRDCMESFEWPEPPPAAEKEPEITRDEVLSAVKEGLEGQSALTRDPELNKDDIFEAVRAGIDEVSGRLDSNVGSEVLERLHDLVEGMKTEFQQYSAASGRDTEQVLDAVKDGLEVLRSEIETYVDRASDVTGKDEILDTVKDGFRLLQSDLEKAIAESAADTAVARGVPDTPELLDAMEKEFEHLRSSLSNLLIRDGVSNDKDEILDAIRDITEGDRPKGDSSDVVNLVKEEFEHLRETLSMTMVKPNSVETDDIIAALKENFDALQEESLSKKEGNESVVSGTGELLDAVHDGVDAIREDLEKVLNKPSDQDVSYEILDTLKEGLASVKADIERLHEAQSESEETSSSKGKEISLANESGIGHDIEGLKVLITQLQIKVDAIETNPAAAEPSEDYIKKEDLAEVLAAVKDVQGSVTEAGTRELAVNDTAATKDDTDAIETLLRNTKAKIDEFTFPEPEGIAKSEQVESLEALIKESKESLDALGSRIDTSELSTKADISTLETLLKDIWVTVEDLQSKQEKEEESKELEVIDEEKEEEPEKVLKSDIQTLEAMIFEVKTQIEELALPDVEALPTKLDIGGLSELVTGFQEKVEAENELTAQAFEARKIEHGGIAEKIEEAKGVVEELRDDLKAKLEGSEEGISELQKTLDVLNESAGTFATADSLKELSELINREFERSHGELEASKVDTEERDAAALVKQDEARAAVIHELGNKLDEKFGDIIAKYDDAQAAADSKFTAIEERDTQSLEAVMSTKSIAEDLKLVIGGMGNSVTETCEQMSLDAKTFFQRVDESYTKMEDIQAGVKAQHEETKEELEKTIAGTGRVETKMDEYHPQLLSQIKDIMMIVGQHFEHSRQSIDEIKTGVSAIPAAIPPLLPALPPPPSPKIEPVVEKYDDTQVHDKLNELLTHASNAGESFSRMNKLDEIHQQVLATSREVSEMVAAQSRLTQEDQESRQKEAQETALQVERNLAQKESIEAEIAALNEEREALRGDVRDLKQEKDVISKQNTKLAKELSALETALKIRREEMQLMEDRAEGLERRIVDGVLDHARSLLVSRPSTTKDMNLKRVGSSASTVTRGGATPAKEGNSLSSSVGMALKRRNPARSNGGTSTPNAGKERRILSLSNMNGNRGSDRHLALAPANSSGLGNLKRSHSVKSSYPARKHSWGSRASLANKENEVFNEEEEGPSGDESDTGTERRTSYTGTFTDSMSYVTGSRLSTDQQSSYVGDDSIMEESENESEYAEESGGESEQDTALGELESHEDAEPEEEHDDLEPPKPSAGELVMYAPHSDSGLGTDMRSDLSEKVE
ncbi:hypothetical protein FQN54_008436 [Arachnomyces sp. PD_36]|nr:hypothetical protein FQN54_008436 [Arachnomyces sp. PD_36]